jgi:hypothetical protein
VDQLPARVASCFLCIFSELARELDTLVDLKPRAGESRSGRPALGRKTYEGFAKAWPSKF